MSITTTVRLVLLVFIFGMQLAQRRGVRAMNDCSKYKILDNDELPCNVKLEILRVHNTLRQQLAKGQIKGQPRASNMREMYWDEELARGAQAWAEHCTFEHNSNKEREVGRFQVGQNIGITRTMGAVEGADRIDFPKHIRSWFDEHKRYKFSPINGDQKTGHYTQVAWATTYLVGCGYIRYKDSKNVTSRFYVCNYGPAGNVMKKKPYKVGRRLKCASDFRKSTTYDGLCGLKNAPEVPCREEEEVEEEEEEDSEEDSVEDSEEEIKDDGEIEERLWSRRMLHKNKTKISNGDAEDCSAGYCITGKTIKTISKVETLKDNETTTDPHLKKIYNLITINIFH